MQKGILNKILVILILFTLLFSNCGFTLSAIATSEEFEVITKGFFQKDEIKFDASFIDSSDKRVDEIVSDVNGKVRLELTIKPQVDGFLKDGLIKAVSEDGSNLNFKISQIENNGVVVEKKDNTSNTEVNNDESIANEVVENTVENVVSNTVENTVTNEVAGETTNEINNNTINTNTIDNKIDIDSVTNAGSKLQDVSKQVNNVANEIATNVVNELATNVVTNTETSSKNEIETNTNTTIDASTNVVENVPQEDINKEEADTSLVDEEEIIQEKYNEKNNSEKNQINNEYQVVDDTSIKVSNIIDETKIVLELEFNKEEKLTIDSLLQKIKLQFSGTFINKDLEEVKIALEEEKTIGWKYTKDIELTSEYTKFSPFVVSDVTGTIVENKISVKREITDKNYLPLKSNSIEITVPEVNGKKPMAVEVSAIKLMATRGEDSGEATFTSNNWNYDENSGIISILIENGQEGKAVYSNGIDELMIIYRFEDYIDETSNLSKKVNVNVEEYSAEVNKINKSINSNDEVNVDIGELVTYSIESDESKINKSLVNAGYNSTNSEYEAEFENNVSLKILTSDLIEEIKIDMTQDQYIDSNENRFNLSNVKYKQIVINKSDIIDLIQNGGEVVITDVNNSIISFINKDTNIEEDTIKLDLKNNKGVNVWIKNISSNGIINFKVIKALSKCEDYDFKTFNSFKKVESSISADVKYSKIEDVFHLSKISTIKELEEGVTKATLSMNKEYLTSIKRNDNVEFKIELNNDKENSDMYKNPYFEIVFPKNIKEVSIENINILYADGLNIKDYQVYTESDIVKLKVELEGSQEKFSTNNLSNGTNIILNLNIVLDEYTSAKEDQIKLYYFNENVTKYESQTKWSINEQKKDQSILDKNGFDAIVFDYKVPDGLVTVNTIKNYGDGLKEIRSVRQGEKTDNIEINSSSKIATMELLAMNNTGNICSDVVMLGRIPFVGNKNVVTGEKLNNNVDTSIVSLITENSINANITEIYYSTNGEATKDLDNIGNGWTKEPTDISQVKSYLIVVKGNVQSGSILRFKYDFNIPENLKYESRIEGSFGAFYNNNSDISVIYESSVADKVGLTTIAGPKVDTTMTVDVGDGVEVGECRFLNYTIKIQNTGSEIVNGIEIKNTIPNNTELYEETTNIGTGNNNYNLSDKKELNWKIDSLNVGEYKEFTYMVKTKEFPNELEMENNELYIENFAEVNISNLAITKTSNVVKNKLVDSLFNMEVTGDYNKAINVGAESSMLFSAQNITEEELKDVVIEADLPSNIECGDYGLNLSGHGEVKKNESGAPYIEDYTDKYSITLDKTTNKLYISISEVYSIESINLFVNFKAISGSNEKVYTEFKITANGKEEKSPKLETTFKGPKLSINQFSNVENQIYENEKVEFLINVQNIGNGETNSLSINDAISENLKDITVEISGYYRDSITSPSNILNIPIKTLPENEKVSILISGTADIVEDGETKVISNKAEASDTYCETVSTDILNVSIINNPNMVEEKVEDDSEGNTSKEEEITNDESNSSQSNTENESTDSSNENSSNSSNELNNLDENNNEQENSQSQNENNNALTNNTSNSSSNDVVNIKDSNEKDENVVESKHNISGYVWEDLNKNGSVDEDEKNISAVKVQLFKDSNMIQTTLTDGNGLYSFKNVSSGNYVVMFLYDKNEYIPTIYENLNIDNKLSSKAIRNSDNTAITNNIALDNADIENINLGLQKVEKFNLSINKYIVKTTLKTKNKEEKQEYNNSKLEKVEIKAKEIADSYVKLEYLIKVNNDSEIVGKIDSIVDYLPAETKLIGDENKDWYLGDDGYIYNDSLKNIEIQPGESKEIKLVLVKYMNETNTGVISNKVELKNSMGHDLQEDNSSEDNYDTQEVLVLIKTGYTLQISIYISIILIICFIIKIKFFHSKKYHNNKFTQKIKIKKTYV